MNCKFKGIKDTIFYIASEEIQIEIRETYNPELNRELMDEFLRNKENEMRRG